MPGTGPKPPEDHRARLGRLGEAVAAEELKRRGYLIRARNYRCRRGEADLVADLGETLVFVEVKTRSTLSRGLLPRDAVGWSKQRRLGVAALHYCARYDISDRPIRFDVVEVVTLGSDVAEVLVIEDAFSPDV